MPVFKGTYPETLNAGIAAFRAGQAPDIIQVFDVGTGVMMGAEGAVKPVADVLTNAGMTFDKSAYLPGIVAYYSKPDGTMLSFPYNSSSPITYYNKDIFKKAGLDPNTPPKTWDDVWSMAKKIKESGAADCGYTSTWLTWIHLENFAAWNNVPYATKRTGLPAPTPELQINAPIFVNHFQADRRSRQGRHVQIRRPHLRGQADLPGGRMRDHDRKLRRSRRHRQVRHELRHRPAAL